MNASASTYVPVRLRGLPLLRMQWRHLLFMHWPVPAEHIKPLIPRGLEVDVFDGLAWVGLVPFAMRDVLPSIIPSIPGISDVPAISAFEECNVRTYVHHAGQPDEGGVWFFSLDAASRAAVWSARRFFHLPYYYARVTLERHGDEVRYAVDRVDSPKASMRCIWRAGRSLPLSRPGELVHFLTERFVLYSAESAGRLYRCRIQHERWPLREAELLMLDDQLVSAAGIRLPAGSPIVHHADQLDVRAWPLESI